MQDWTRARRRRDGLRASVLPAAPALLLMAALALPAAADYRRGVQALGVLDYATALSEFRSALANGDQRALFEIGLIYERGHGVAADPDEAARWYRKAAAENNDLTPGALARRVLARRALARVEAASPPFAASAPDKRRQGPVHFAKLRKQQRQEADRLTLLQQAQRAEAQRLARQKAEAAQQMAAEEARLAGVRQAQRQEADRLAALKAEAERRLAQGQSLIAELEGKIRKAESLTRQPSQVAPAPMAIARAEEESRLARLREAQRAEAGRLAAEEARLAGIRQAQRQEAARLAGLEAAPAAAASAPDNRQQQAARLARQRAEEETRLARLREGQRAEADRLARLNSEEAGRLAMEEARLAGVRQAQRQEAERLATLKAEAERRLARGQGLIAELEGKIRRAESLAKRPPARQAPQAPMALARAAAEDRSAPAVRAPRSPFRAGLYGEQLPYFVTAFAVAGGAVTDRRPADGQLVVDLAAVGALDAQAPAEARQWAVGRGRDLFQEGRYAEATPFVEKALELSDRQLGAAHGDTGALLHDLAKLMRIQGRNAEAEPLYKRSVEVFEKALGADHPRVASSLDSLAGLYLDQGRLAEAEPLYGRSLAIREKALGAAHPLVAASLNNLAELYRGQGRLGEAEPLHKRSLAISEKALGPGHPHVGLILSNLAELYRAQGRTAEAEPFNQRSMEILLHSGKNPAPGRPKASPPGLL